VEEKEELIEAIQEATGRLPNGTRLILDVLTQPDVIEFTKRFIQANDEAGKCLNYQDPWNCAKEAEAKYRNIKYGWLAGNGVGFDESWCEPCRRRVMEG
jgi:hypothetical protein